MGRGGKSLSDQSVLITEEKMVTTYRSEVMHLFSEKKTLIQRFSLWRELVLDLAYNNSSIQENAEFCLDVTGVWVPIPSNEKIEMYQSPEWLSGETKLNRKTEEVYVLGAILFETLFGQTVWQAYRIRQVDQFVNLCEHGDFFDINRYTALDYVSKQNGESENEVLFIFHLVETMLTVKPEDRPKSIQQVASWISEEGYNNRSACFYSIPKKENEVDTTCYLGIDFGTTNTVVVMAKSGRLSEVRIDDSLTVPTAVFFENPETIYFGKEAVKRGIQYPGSLARSFKLYLHGADGKYPDLFYAKTGEKIDITGMELSRRFLAWVRNRAIQLVEEPLNYVVVTVPAEFDSRQIESIKRAAQGAGFSDVAIEREPNAAGYAYLHSERLTFSKRRNILVYDFGGGTFDVAILQRTNEESFEIIGRDGDRHLGGDDFTAVLMKWIEERVQEIHYEFSLADQFNYTDEQKFLRAKGIISQAANEAKVRLTEKQAEKIKLRQLPIHDDQLENEMFELSRIEYEQLIEPFVLRAEEAMKRALKQAELEKDVRLEDIDDVVLAGGTSLTPLIQQSVEQYFGKLSNKS